MRLVHKVALPLVVLVTPQGCGPTKTIGTTPVDGSVARPAARDTDPGSSDARLGDRPTNDNGGSGSKDVLGKDAALLNATYNVNARALGITVCKGEVQFKLNANHKAKDGDDSVGLFDIPAGIVDCGLIGKINLAEVLGGFSGGAKNPITVKNDIIALNALGDGRYEPPRPLMPSFLAASPAKLRSMNVSVTSRVTDTAENKSAEGTTTVRALAFDDRHTPPDIDWEFKKVFHFEVENQGYDGVNKVGNFIFDRMEFKINLDPVAVLFIQFDGMVSDLKAAKDAADAKNGTGTGTGTGTGGGGLFGGGGLGGLIIGAVTKLIQVNITMDLVSQDGLDPRASAAEDEGPVIGGNKKRGED